MIHCKEFKLKFLIDVERVHRVGVVGDRRSLSSRVTERVEALREPKSRLSRVPRRYPSQGTNFDPAIVKTPDPNYVTFHLRSHATLEGKAKLFDFLRHRNCFTSRSELPGLGDNDYNTKQDYQSHPTLQPDSDLETNHTSRIFAL